LSAPARSIRRFCEKKRNSNHAWAEENNLNDKKYLRLEISMEHSICMAEMYTGKKLEEIRFDETWSWRCSQTVQVRFEILINEFEHQIQLGRLHKNNIK
jgi:hypothetical protein